MKTFYLVPIFLILLFVMPSENYAEGEKRVEKIISNSIRWGDFENTYSYDKCGKYSKAVREKIEGEELLDWDFKAYTYDEDGNLIAEIYDWHDGEVWQDCDSITYTYDDSDNLLLRLYIYCDSGTWFTMERTTNTYDESGNMLTTYNENGDQDGTGWLPNSRTSNTFDAEGNLIVEFKERVVAGEMTNYYLNKFTYNDKNLRTGYTQEYWIDKWDSVGRGEYIYDSEDNLVESISEGCSNGVWSNASRTVQSFDANGKILVSAYERWIGGTWTGYNRQTYTWNQKGVLTEYLIELFSNGEYVNSKSQIFTLAEDVYRTNISSKAWVAGQWIDSDYNIGMTDSAGNRFIFNTFYNMDISWSGGTSVESDIDENLQQLLCFPNPAYGIVNINYTLLRPGSLTVSISNTQGREISRVCDNQIKVPGEHALSYNTSALAPGVYYINVQSNGVNETKKFVVVR